MAAFGCKDDTPAGDDHHEVPAIYGKIYGATSITSDGVFITIKTMGTPDLRSVSGFTARRLLKNYFPP